MPTRSTRRSCPAGAGGGGHAHPVERLQLPGRRRWRWVWPAYSVAVRIGANRCGGVPLVGGRCIVQGYPPPPKTCAHKNLPTRSVSGLRAQTFNHPPTHATKPERQALPPLFLRGVTSIYRRHRRQTGKSGVNRCHHWIFFVSYRTGDKAKTTGDTGDNPIHHSARRCGAPCPWCLVHATRPCTARRMSLPRRPSAAPLRPCGVAMLTGWSACRCPAGSLGGGVVAPIGLRASSWPGGTRGGGGHTHQVERLRLARCRHRWRHWRKAHTSSSKIAGAIR